MAAVLTMKTDCCLQHLQSPSSHQKKKNHHREFSFQDFWMVLKPWLGVFLPPNYHNRPVTRGVVICMSQDHPEHLHDSREGSGEGCADIKCCSGDLQCHYL